MLSGFKRPNEGLFWGVLALIGITILLSPMTKILGWEITWPGADADKEPSIEEVSPWLACPVKVSGSVKTSSLRFDVSNKTSRDIDAIKLLVVCRDTDTNIADLGYCTIDDTLWAYDKVNKTLAGDYYWHEVQAYVVCVYFKDGTKWGNSGASTDEIIKNSPAFTIERFQYTAENH